MKIVKLTAAVVLLFLTACQPAGNEVTVTAASAENISPPAAEATHSATTAPTATESPVVPTATASVTTTEAPTGAPADDKRLVANADVTFVRAVQAADGRWTFYVTVAHPDTGWEDYADGWDVILLDGTLLKPDPDSPFTRLLLHPHENEQPFTRSQSGIVIPEGESQVIVRAHDIIDGFGGAVVTVDLTVAEGDGFSVER